MTSQECYIFSVYIETGSSTSATTLAFTIAAATGSRSWKVIIDRGSDFGKQYGRF